MKWTTLTSEICSILGTVFALFGAINSYLIHNKLKQEEKRLNKKIRVVLTDGSNKYELPVKLRREELDRAEVLGYLGMIPMKSGVKVEQQPRFSLKYTNKQEFFQEINNIKASNGEHILTIPCTEDEFKQFDIQQK